MPRSNYTFAGGIDVLKAREIEEAAAKDPKKAAKQFKLSKTTYGAGNYTIFSGKPDWNSPIPHVQGRLLGAEEKAFLDAIPKLK